MSHLDIISEELLSKIPIFEKLSVADLAVLAKLWKPRPVRPGEVLFRKGDTGDSMFIIEEGIVEISVPDQFQKKDIRVSVLHQGEFFGELSIIDGLPRTAKATVMEDSRFLEMKRDDFIRFLMDRPAVAISMVSEIGKRLRATNELVTSLASKNVNEENDEQMSFGDRLADKITEFGGSWKFIITFAFLLACWIILNSVLILIKPFDFYPFVFLNLVLGAIAAFQAPMIMMSQNRAQKKDRLRAELDYQVNLKSELMLQQLHAKVDEIRAAELQVISETLQVELALIRRRLEELDAESALNNP
jgi:CRP/FNR family cyclic AMP-dependent transcriptional regulator